MRIEKAVCPHCGGPIEVRSHKVIKCEYCGMPIVISDLDLDDADNNGFEDTVTVDETITYEDFPIDIVKAARKHSYWTLVGFRTKKNWKMICASIFYLVLLIMLFVPSKRAYNILSVILLFFIAQVFFSWQPLVDTLPGLKSKDASISTVCKAGYIFASIIIGGILAPYLK